MKTSPNAPLPSFYKISKSYNFISLIFFIAIFSFTVMKSFLPFVASLLKAGLGLAI